MVSRSVWNVDNLPQKHCLLLFSHYRDLSQRGGQRSNHIVEALLKHGYKVSVIVPGIDPLTGEKSRQLGFLPWKRESRKGLTIYRVNSCRNIRRIKMMRIFYFLTSSFMQLIIGMFISRRYGVVMCNSYPPSLMAISWLLAKLNKKPLIIDVRDLGLDSAFSSGYVKQNSGWKKLLKLEELLFQKANSLAVISPGIMKILAFKKVSLSKMHYIPIGYDHESSAKIDNLTKDLRNKYGVNDAFLVLYAGSMGHLLDLNTMLKAAEKTRDRGDILYIFAGDGERVIEGKKFLEKQGLDNAQFIGPVPKAEITRLCKAADVCLYTLGNNPIYSFFLGNKVFDYLGSGTPMIFCGPTGDISDLIKKSGGGSALPPEDYESLAEKIIYLKDNPEEKQKMGEKAKNYIYSRYLVQHSMDHFCNIVNEVISK